MTKIPIDNWKTAEKNTQKSIKKMNNKCSSKNFHFINFVAELIKKLMKITKKQYNYH